MFIKYQHLERLGRQETEDIEIGTCHIFPKLDGTNASVWIENGEICAGSRNRKLTLDNDNAGFFNAIINDEKIFKYLMDHPTHTLYGEWLVPHTLKTYEDTAWRKFYVFDVYDRENDLFIHYDKYKNVLDEYGIEYVPVMAVYKNPSIDSFNELLQRNIYLIKDGQGVGEGIVIKNYDYRNKYGRLVFAKIVRNEFKTMNSKEFNPMISEIHLVEDEIIEKYATDEFIKKEFNKLRNIISVEDKKTFIPRLFSTIWYEFLREETTEFVKHTKMAKIDFKRLNKLLIHKIKSVLQNELF